MRITPPERKSSVGRGPGWRTVLRRELGAAGRLVVLGVGNEDRGDDAAGILCVRLLRKTVGSPERRGLLFLEGGVAPENMTGKIRAFAPSHVLILDAALAGRKPGAIFPVNSGNITEEELTTHRLPLSHLIRFLEESVGCRVLCLGIQPRALETGGPLSRNAGLAIRTLARACASLLRQRRPSPAPPRPGARKKPGRKKRLG